jgi:hypothetical protein
MYLPGSTSKGDLAWLKVPATWPGGERRIKCRVNHEVSRYIDGRIYVWCVITARTDEHKPRGERFFIPERMIEFR